MEMILAIDPGTNSAGWAVFTEEGLLLEAGSESANSKDRLDRSIQITLSLLNEIPQLGNITQIVFEDPLLRGKGNNTLQRFIGQLECGLILNISGKPKFTYIPPMTVKAHMGSGSFGKADMYRAVRQVCTLPGESDIVRNLASEHDAIDAVAIGLTYLKRKIQHGSNDNDDSKLQYTPKTKKKKSGKSKCRR